MIKDWFKVGFGVAAGIAVGEYVAKVGISSFGKAITNICIRKAKAGDPTATRVCQNLNIDFENHGEEKPEAKMQMGFHA